MAHRCAHLCAALLLLLLLVAVVSHTTATSAGPLSRLQSAAAAASSAQSAVEDQCSAQTDCRKCALVGGTGVCGFCAYYGGARACIPFGQADACGQKGQFIQYQMDCPVIPGLSCGDFKSCRVCSEAPAEYNCGWCESSKQCVSGSPSGPDASAGSCDSPYWGFGRNSCSSAAIQCEAESSSGCNYCTSINGCAWCESTSSCAVATDKSSEQCFQLIKTQPACSAAKDLCASNTDCLNCIDAPHPCG